MQISDKVNYFTCLILFSLISSRISIDIGFNLNLSYLLCILVFIYCCFKKWQSYKILYILMPLIIFYTLSALTLLYSFSIERTARYILGVITFWFMFINFFSYIFKNRASLYASTIFLSKGYIIITLTSYILGLLFINSGREGELIYGVLIEKGIPRCVGLLDDPNMTALVMNFFFIFLYDTSKKEKKISTFIFTLICLTLSILTLSRGSLISLIIAFLIYVLSSNNLKEYFRLCGLIFISVIAILAFHYIDPTYLNEIIAKRISGLSTGGGRFTIWEHAIELFNQKPILGHGAFSFIELNKHYYNGDRFAHNTYLEILVEFGIMGLMLYLTGLIFVLHAAIKWSCEFKFLPATAILLYISMFSLSIYINPILNFYLLILCLFICTAASNRDNLH